jgi:centromere protein I
MRFSALLTIQTAARTPARQRSTNVGGIVEKLSRIVYQTGLSNHFLSRLIDVITLPNELDQASLAALIRNMYPAEKVPDAIVVNVVASFGHGRSKPSLSIQNALLKWLISIYDVLMNQKILSELYAVLFNLLDTLALRFVDYGCLTT